MLEEKLTAGILVEKTNRQVQQKGLIKKIITYINNYNLDVFLGPEWLFVPKEKLYTKEEKKTIIQCLAEGTKDRDTLIIPGSIMWEDDNFFYNTAPVISGGKLLGEYHKQLDGGDTGNAYERDCKKKMFQEGEYCIKEWKGRRLGVEICADAGTLYDKTKEEKTPLLDLYFLLSCGVNLHTHSYVPLKTGGFALSSEGSDPAGYFFKCTENDGMKKLHSQDKEGLAVYDLVKEKPKEGNIITESCSKIQELIKKIMDKKPNSQQVF